MAIRNKIAKSFPMWSKGSIIIAQFSKYKITISQNRRSFSMLSILKKLRIFSCSRGPDWPDLPSPFGRKFQLSVQFRSLDSTMTPDTLLGNHCNCLLKYFSLISVWFQKNFRSFCFYLRFCL